MNQPSDLAGAITIEPMGEEDIAAVAAIEKKSFSDPWPEEAFQNELFNNRLAAYYVARLEDRVIAYIGAWLVLDEVHITTLAVEEACRRRGIASRLLKTLVKKAGTGGARFLTLEVRPSNKAALCFYEKFGFSVLGRRKRYYIDEDALIMTKETAPSFDGEGGEDA